MYSINVFARNFIILHFTILSVFVYNDEENDEWLREEILFLVLNCNIGYWNYILNVYLCG